MQSVQNFFAKPSRLGLLGVGIVLVGTSVAFLKFSQDSSNESSPKKRRELALSREPPGIKNYGNTCFINCILQALAGLPFFMNFLQKLCEMCLDETRLENRITEHLLDTIGCLNNNENETIYPGDLIEGLRNKVDFRFYQEQQDCHELLKLLMDVLDSTLKEKTQDLSRSINPKSLTDEVEQDLVNPFNGYMAQVLICKRCGQESNIKLDCFNDLSMIIKESDIHDLSTVFDHFFKPEAVEDVECMGCSIAALVRKKKHAIETVDRLTILSEKKCKYIMDLQEQIEYLKTAQNKAWIDQKELTASLDRRVKKQTEKYANDPNVEGYLRHSFTMVKSNMQKCLRFARLPKILCIHLQRLTYDKYGDVVKVNKHIAFNNELSLQPWLDLKLFSEDTAKSKYRLSSVIRHLGTESFGHYVTYRRVYKQNGETGEITGLNGASQTWSYTSDETTYIVPEKEVLNSPAYMLFYEKI